MFIINAPWIFRSVWVIAKSWFDKHTASKILITKKIPNELFSEMMGNILFKFHKK